MSKLDKNKITAIDIYDNHPEFNEKVQAFANDICRRAGLDSEYTLQMQSLFPDEKAWRKHRAEVLNSDPNFKQFFGDIERQKREKIQNYIELRNSAPHSTDIVMESAQVERVGLQTDEDGFVSFVEIVDKSIKNNNLFKEVYTKKKEAFIQELSSGVMNTFEQVVAMDFDKKDSESGKEFVNTNFSSAVHNAPTPLLNAIGTLRNMYHLTRDMMNEYDYMQELNMLTNLDYADDLSKEIRNIFIGGAQLDYMKEVAIENPQITSPIISMQLLSRLLSKKYVSTNRCVCLQNSFTNNINAKYFNRMRTLGELFLEITNPHNEALTKEQRLQIYMTNTFFRPNNEKYHTWNGLQVFDIDLKKWLKDSNTNIHALKSRLFVLLKQYHWFLWICLSSSGKGIHIYTKVAPPHHIYLNVTDNEKISKYWHHVSYLSKSSLIYQALEKTQMFSGTDFENIYLDNVVSRMSSGIKLSYDPQILVNPNFEDVHVALGLGASLEHVFSEKEIARIFHRNNTDKFHYLKMINRINEIIENNEEERAAITSKLQNIDYKKYINNVLVTDLSVYKPIPDNINKYYTRFHVCNTLGAILGKDGIEIAHKILQSDKFGNRNEISNFYACGITNKKEPSLYAIKLLQECGVFTKEINEEVRQIAIDQEKTNIKKHIDGVCNSKILGTSTDNKKYTFTLDTNQYLSSIMDDVLGLITGEKINVILSPAGSGKTIMFKELSKRGKRVLLVLPFISVIENKIETDEEISATFEIFYGDRDISQITYGKNAVCTFDKFSRASVEKMTNIYDYIFIDESHLLFTSAYRIESTAQMLRKIKDLYYHSNIAPNSAKVVLMTGTQTGEQFFFKNVGNFVNIGKKMLKKELEVLVCDDALNALCRMAYKSAQLLQEGYRLLIPTNNGEVYAEKIIGMIRYILNREVKYGYYKRSNSEQEICRLINQENTVGDYEVIFCSNYLSVGIDIEDTDKKFASIYNGNFSAFEIEQFNARIRKANIKCVYVYDIKEGLITTEEEPELMIHLTDDDKLFFLDDKEISKAKSNFVAQYDPILKSVRTPGFTFFNGKMNFNPEEYELLTFENKYQACMIKPIKVCRELARYDYEVSIITDFEGLPQDKQKKLKEIGLISAKEEKVKKHTELVGTFIDLVNCNSYVNEYGLEFNNTIEWIQKNLNNKSLVIENREQEEFVKVIFDTFATPIVCKVRSMTAIDKMLKHAKYLLSVYSPKRCCDMIFQYVNEDGILKQSKFLRAINLSKLIASAESDELSEPISMLIEKIYNYIDYFHHDSTLKVSSDSLNATLDSWTYDYIESLGIVVNTKYGFDKLKDGIVEMMQIVGNKQVRKGGIRFEYNKIPDNNNSELINKNEVDAIISNMFSVTKTLYNNCVTERKSMHVISDIEEQHF